MINRSGLLLRTLTYHPDHLVDHPHGHGRAALPFSPAEKMDGDALVMSSAAPASVQKRSLYPLILMIPMERGCSSGSVQVDLMAEMVTQKSSIQMQTQIQILALLSLSTVEHLRFVQ